MSVARKDLNTLIPIFGSRRLNGLLPKWAYGAVFLIPKVIFVSGKTIKCW